MIPKRPFYFLRHGETNWNREGRYQGLSDIPLNATGIAQAHAAAARLAEIAIDRIVTSPLIRALATAGIVAEKLQKPIHIDRGLVERNFGSFNGRIIREVKQQHGLRPDQSSRAILPPDANPWQEIFDRIPPLVAKWMTGHPNDTFLFVAHGGVFDALHKHMLGPRSGAESGHAAPYLATPLTADGNWPRWKDARFGQPARAWFSLLIVAMPHGLPGWCRGMGLSSSLPSRRPRTCPHLEAAPNSPTLALSAWRNIAPPLKIASAIGVPPS